MDRNSVNLRVSLISGQLSIDSLPVHCCEQAKQLMIRADDARETITEKIGLTLLG